MLQNDSWRDALLPVADLRLLCALMTFDSFQLSMQIARSSALLLQVFFQAVHLPLDRIKLLSRHFC